MIIEIVKNNVCVGLDVEFDADGEADVKFNTPDGNLVDRVSQITSGWSYQDPQNQEDLESIINYLDGIDWDLWLQDVKDGDIFKIEDATGSDGVKFAQVERVN